MLHELKIWPKYFAPVATGAKCFELRKADRPYTLTDHLHLREWDPSTLDYTGRDLFAQVTYILPIYITDEHSLYVILSIRLVASLPADLQPSSTSTPTKHK
jgi:hypothetical protein